MWYLEHPDAHTERDALDQAGLTIPAWLYPPTVRTGYETWLDAFFDLSSERASTDYRVGAIPPSAVAAYGRLLGLSPDEYDSFRLIIRRLDGIYLRHVGGQAPDGVVFNKEIMRGSNG